MSAIPGATAAPPKAYGVFKPVGHVVIAVPNGDDARDASAELLRAGFTEADQHAYTPQEMLAQTDDDLSHASAFAGVGQELNLVRAHRELALKGHYFLVVRAENSKATERITDVAIACHASRAQHYGRLLIEELIPVGASDNQVAESNDRGLDSQTVSGNEERP